MAENDSSQIPPISSPPSDEAGTTLPPAGPPRKKRRIWLRIVLIALIVVVLFILLIPAIISTGMVRGMVVNRINDQLNGKLAINDWSFGWGGGIRIDGITLHDADGRQILQLASISAHAPPLDLLRGKYHVGKVAIDGLDFYARRDADGKLNFSELSKPSPKSESEKPKEEEKKPAEKSEPEKLPDIQGEIALTNARGTVEDVKTKQTVHLTSISADVNWPGTNEPLTDSLEIVADTGAGTPGKISASGTALVTKDNALLIDPAALQRDGNIDQKASITALDLAALAPMLGLQLTGSTEAQLTARVTPGADTQLLATIGLTKVQASGGAAPANGQQFHLACGPIMLTVKGAGKLDGGFDIATNAAVQSLDVQRIAAGGAATPVLQNYNLNLDSKAKLAADARGSHLDLANLDVTDNQNLLAVHKSDATVQLTSGTGADAKSPGLLNMITKADASIEMPALAKLSELMNTLSPAPPGPKPRAQLTGGSATISLTAARSGDQLLITKQISTNGLMVKAGDAEQKIEPLDFSVAASIVPIASPAANASLLQQVQEVDVTQLAAHLVGTEVSLKKPLKVTDLAAVAVMPSVSVDLLLKGDIAPLAQLMETLDGAKPGSEYPYSGAFAFEQTIGTASGSLSLNGNGDITDFAMHDGQTTTFSEKDIHLGEDVAVASDENSIAINGLTVSMPTTKALDLSVKGKLAELKTQRLLQNVTADVTYDLGPLWKIIFPLLPKARQDSLKDAQVAGQFTKHFVVNGSYPANVAFNEAVKNITMTGGLAVGSFKGSGIDLANLDVPIYMSQGKALIANSGKPNDYAAPATMNGGQFSLAGAQLDLGDVHSRFSMPANSAVLKNVSLNPTLADALGKDVGNFLFVGTSNASGLLDATIVKCDRFPLDDLMKQNTPANDGYLELNVSISDLNLAGGQLASLSSVISTNSLRGSVKQYKIVIQHGTSTHDMTLTLGEQARPILLTGDVNLSNEAMNMTLTLPPTMLRTNALANGLVIPFHGTVSSPQFDAAGAIQKTLLGGGGGGGNPQDILKGLIGGAGGGNAGSSPGGQSAQPGNNAEQNAVNSLENLLGGEKKKKKKKKPASAPAADQPAQGQ